MALPDYSENRVTEAEYLEYDFASEFKNEFIDGKIVAMSGASRAHLEIETNLVTGLQAVLLKKGCRTFGGNARVTTPETGDYFYPDATVICGEPIFDTTHRPESLTNPVVIFEVLSRSTSAKDRGAKLVSYRTIPSLQEYVLVSQYEPMVERISRNPDGTWLTTIYQSMDATLALSSIDVTLPLTDIYARVEFEADDTD